MPLEEVLLLEELQRRADREEGPKEHGIPSRWWDANVRRCRNDHVSTMTLKSERLGGNVCLICKEPVYLTFPEDIDGQLELTGPIWTDQERATSLIAYIRLCPERPCDEKWAYGLAACRDCYQMRLAFGPEPVDPLPTDR